MHVYDSDFYRYIGSGSLRSARVVANVLLEEVRLPVRSVLDVGCGAGAWLQAWKEAGCEVLGIDGPYVTPSSLHIDAAEFQAHDLSTELALGRRFDLALCLEVAEHLPAANAPVLVASLCCHADLVLFSAAPPGQGGENHVNERHYAYWRDLFGAHGFVMHDVLRPRIVNNRQVSSWYRYNTFLYVSSRASQLKQDTLVASVVPSECSPPDLAPWHYRIRRRLVALLPASVASAIAVTKKRLINSMAPTE